MSRWPLAVALVLSAGCGAKSGPPTHKNTESGSFGADTAPPSTAAPALWGVRTFDEKPGWLEGTRLAEGAWGARMAIAVERALDARRVDAHVIPAEVKGAQLEALYAKGLQYLCEGTLTGVTAAGGKTSLVVAYRLKRRLGDDTRTVQARRVEVSTTAVALDESALAALLDDAAAKIADAVLADVPADLLAIRG